MRLHRFQPIFALALELQALGLNFGHLIAQGRAGGEIGEALEGEELRGGVIAVGGKVRGGAEDLFVSVGKFFVVGRGQEIDVALRESFEDCERDFLVPGQACVDDVEESFGIKLRERVSRVKRLAPTTPEFE
ncbi:MAG: hypothetical protein ACXW32_14800 [Limisphaerales bacterium]